MKKVARYIVGVLRAVAGLKPILDMDDLSRQVVTNLKEKGFEIRPIEQKQEAVEDLTPSQVLLLPGFSRLSDPSTVHSINQVMGGMHYNTEYYVPDDDRINSAMIILNAFKAAGYARVKDIAPPALPE